MNGDGRFVDEKHYEDDADKKSVEHQGGEYLYNRQHTDAEIDFFQEIGVFDDGVSSAVETLTEEEPGDDTGKHPENKRDISGRLGFEANLKNKPEDEDVDGRMNEGPEYAEIRAEILAPEIPVGQLNDHLPSGKNLFYEY
jgi:hypothetical protein